MENLKEIIESLFFVAETALTVDRIKQVTAADTMDIKNAIQALAAEYEARGGGFYLNEVAGGYQIRTRPEYNEWIKRLIQPNPPRMSKAALETLAIIAYKQPIIRSDIEHIRGVDSGGVLRLLLERKLIRVLGRKEIPGRPLIYATTKQFLEVFDLKDLKDLPTPREIESFGKSLLDESPLAESDETEDSFDAESSSQAMSTPSLESEDDLDEGFSASVDVAGEDEAFPEKSSWKPEILLDEDLPEASDIPGPIEDEDLEETDLQ